MGLDVQVVNGLTRIPDEEVPDGMEPYSEEFYEWEENTDNYIKFIDRENG